MTKIVIIGNGTYSVMLSKYIKMTTDWEICAFAVDENCIIERVLNGIDVISLKEMQERYDASEVKLVMGIGYSKMGTIKERQFKICTSWGYEFINYIHPTAIISPDAKLGSGNVIFEGVIIEQGVEIGNANMIYCGSVITHETCIGDFNSFSANVAIAGCVKIGHNNYFGLGSGVKDHLELGSNIMVGAMAYCHRNVKNNTIIVPPKSPMMEGREGLADSINMF